MISKSRTKYRVVADPSEGTIIMHFLWHVSQRDMGQALGWQAYKYNLFHCDNKALKNVWQSGLLDSLLLGLAAYACAALS